MGAKIGCGREMKKNLYGGARLQLKENEELKNVDGGFLKYPGYHR